MQQAIRIMAGHSAFLVAVFLVAAADSASVTPVQKVITLLDGMIEKGKAAKHQEEVSFADLKVFCDDQITQMNRDVSEEDERLNKKKAEIAQGSADADALRSRINQDESDRSAAEQDMAAATKVRAQEKADYETTHKDYSESIDALARAILVLKKQAFNRQQASFAQLSSADMEKLQTMTLIPAEAKKKIDLFFMQSGGDDDGLAVSAPEANAYEFQSNHIIEMFEKLHDKFIEEKTELEKQEANAKHAYNMLMQDLKSRINTDAKDMSESASNKGQVLHEKASDKNDHDQTFDLKQIDTSSLASLEASCAQKKSEFEARQQLREEELQALQQATDILSSGDVSGHAATYLPSLMQTKQTPVLAHLRADNASPAQIRAVQYLQEQAGRINSRVLSVLAARAVDDPFTKVKKMIKDLVVRLMEEANDEAEHKGWCDTELASNKQTREEKTSEVEKLHAQIDELKASIAKISEDISELTDQVAELTKAVAEATKLREEEKTENTQTIADSQAAQTAVAQAKEVLDEFYEKAGEATAFIQAPYQGMQSENTGVIGMLEVIQSDFARLEADTKAQEASSQKEYDDFKTQSNTDISVKNKSIEHKEAKKQDQEQELTLAKNDLEGTQKELDAALSYFDKLKPSCVDAGVSYDDRVARRKEEVESLQEALKILNGEDIA